MGSDSSDELKDDVLQAEIQLLGQLVLAASGMTRHLTPEEVDQLLDAQRTCSEGKPADQHLHPAHTALSAIPTGHPGSAERRRPRSSRAWGRG
jgi:hypothetical protein